MGFYRLVKWNYFSRKHHVTDGTSSNLGVVGLFTTELFALERSHWLWMGKWCLHLFSVTMNSVFIKITGKGTDIKSRTSLKYSPILPVILELCALEPRKKWCLQLFSVTFDRIFVKIAGNEVRHENSNEFQFGPDRIIHFGVTCPWARKFFPIDL